MHMHVRSHGYHVPVCCAELCAAVALGGPQGALFVEGAQRAGSVSVLSVQLHGEPELRGVLSKFKLI